MAWLTANWTTKYKSFYGIFSKQHKLHLGCIYTIKNINKFIVKLRNPLLDYYYPSEIYFQKKNLNKKKYRFKRFPKKERLQKKYKDYKNLLSAILKKSKTKYYNRYFESKWSNIKNTRTGIKSMSTIKSISTGIPKSLFIDVTTIFNPVGIQMSTRVILL